MKITYRISELVPYINWVYYYFAWQVKEEAEKQRMHAEALAKLQELDAQYQVHAVFECSSCSMPVVRMMISRSTAPSCAPIVALSIPCV